MVRSVERQSVHFGSGHDLMVHKIESCVRSAPTALTLFEILSLTLCPFSSLALSLKQTNKQTNIKKLRKV